VNSDMKFEAARLQ